jgi:hypothetical protein
VDSDRPVHGAGNSVMSNSCVNLSGILAFSGGWMFDNRSAFDVVQDVVYRLVLRMGVPHDHRQARYGRLAHRVRRHDSRIYSCRFYDALEWLPHTDNMAGRRSKAWEDPSVTVLCHIPFTK